MTDQELNDVVDRVFALREITRLSGTITKNSQSALLRPLTEADLTEVAVRLVKAEAARNTLAGTLSGR
jgi:non-canonical (house-cleaning) NTP pyrophosphatase